MSGVFENPQYGYMRTKLIVEGDSVTDHSEEGETQRTRSLPECLLGDAPLAG